MCKCVCGCGCRETANPLLLKTTLEVGVFCMRVIMSGG